MANKCKNCGKCCLDTEMPISMQDINEILNKSPEILNKDDFAFKISKAHYQLKNINGHCFFFDLENKSCNIYEFRPQGCKFYPIIFDNDKKKCIYDEFCPRTSLFFLDKKKFKKKCDHVRRFLSEQLKII